MIDHSVILILASVIVHHLLVGGIVLTVNQTRLAIQHLAVCLARVMSQALLCVILPMGHVSVNHSILDSVVISV